MLRAGSERCQAVGVASHDVKLRSRGLMSSRLIYSSMRGLCRFSSGFALLSLAAWLTAPLAPANSRCASALRRHIVCEAANEEAARLITSQRVAAAIVVQDVHTGALVAFASPPPPYGLIAQQTAVGVATPLLPLSVAKVLLAASWWTHEPDIRAEHGSAPADVHEMIATGSDADGRAVALKLRQLVGSEAVLADMERFGFPRCTSSSASSGDTEFWRAIAPEWRAQLTPSASCVSLSPQTPDLEWANDLSLGESGFSVTLLNLSRFLQAVGNGGVMLPPMAQSSSQRSSNQLPAGGGKRILSAATAEKLQSGMLDTVEHGTARSIRGRLSAAWELGGKTGTGPAGSIPYDGCFAGLAFDGKKVARFTVVSYVKRAGPGGGVAAQIASDLIQFIVGLKN